MKEWREVDPEILAMLIASGTGLSPAIAQALAEGAERQFVAVIESSKAFVPLAVVAGRGVEDAVRALIARGALVKESDTKNEALLAAVKRGKWSVAEILI
jgi:hypothetical protein